jgi:hypothetical protein
MGKQWRNLGILVVILIIVSLIVYFVFPQYLPFSTKNGLAQVVEKNNLDLDKFKGSVESLSVTFSPALASDLKNLSSKSSGVDKLYLDTLLQIDSEKSLISSKLSELYDKNQDFCSSLYSYEDQIDESVSKIQDKFDSLSLIKSVYSIDLNGGNIKEDKLLLKDAFYGFDEACVSDLVDLEDNLMDSDLGE